MAVKDEISRLLIANEMPLASKALEMLSSDDGRITAMTDPMEGKRVFLIWQIRSTINHEMNAGAEGYDTLLPELERSKSEQIRTISLLNANENAFLFTSEDFRVLFGIVMYYSDRVKAALAHSMGP